MQIGFINNEGGKQAAKAARRAAATGDIDYKKREVAVRLGIAGALTALTILTLREDKKKKETTKDGGPDIA
ncbi:MAG: hypothetical protein LBR14_03625 [Clostridiales Family XIII bacterium]|jgi:hypothetical protein|nr:hypothetical protein [Clostridiales Family XIII bacterium]